MELNYYECVECGHVAQGFEAFLSSHDCPGQFINLGPRPWEDEEEDEEEEEHIREARGQLLAAVPELADSIEECLSVECAKAALLGRLDGLFYDEQAITAHQHAEACEIIHSHVDDFTASFMALFGEPPTAQEMAEACSM